MRSTLVIFKLGVPMKQNGQKTYIYTSNCLYHMIYDTTRQSAKTPTLKELQEKYKTDAETGLPSKETALRRAAHQGNVGDIEVLIEEYKADINSKSSNGFSSLDWAYFNGHMGAVNTLCWLKADQSLLRPLLSKYVSDTEAEWPTKDIALCRAAEKGSIKDIEVLVNKYKANLDFKNVEGNTPLQLAEKENHIEAIGFIKKLMAPLSEDNGNSPSFN